MLSEFLKSNYANKVVRRGSIQLQNWVVESDIIKRKYVFTTFKDAVPFILVTSDFLTKRKINFTVSNVYNQVEVSILGEITQDDLDSIHKVDYLHSISHDLYGKITSNNFENLAFSERLSLRNNNQHLPTTHRLHPDQFFNEEKIKSALI